MHGAITVFLAASVLALVSANLADAGQPNPASEIRRQVTGSFRFVDPGSHHPIVVWFCRPHAIAADTRIVFVMHGSESKTAGGVSLGAGAKAESISSMTIQSVTT